MKYQVHKFGGSSLANAERIAVLKSLLNGQQEVIVVSAVQGTTSLLQEALDVAKHSDDYLKILTQLEKTHTTIANHLLSKPQCETFVTLLKKDIAEIQDILHAIKLTGGYSKEIQNLILGYGELWSGKIVADYLSASHNTIFLDASTVLFVYEKNNMLCIDWEKSQRALDVFLDKKSFDQIVITGFIASTLDGRRTTLGRNGSDFSSAIFAKLFHAENLIIWTDVDGIFTADPNRVRAAFVIDALSYEEALELAYFGAKVLHPMTIAPVVAQNIPIYIKNSYNPKAKGTHITAKGAPSSYLIKGLTCIDDVALINIEGAGMIGVSGIAARVFDVMHQKNISVILISQASSEHSICFAVSSVYADLAVQALKENLQFEVERKQIESIAADKQCAILAVVGDGMIGAIGVSGKLCSALAKANINIRAISQGSSERNISIVIKNSEVKRALQAVHAGFYLSAKTISIGLIGPGYIGSALLQQLHDAMRKLQEKYQVNLCVRGIMSSHKMLLSPDNLDLNDWQKNLLQSEEKVDLEKFVSHITSDDIPHAVIIDCTASQTIADRYLDFVEKGLNVITPNKRANSGDLNFYKKLKTLVDKKNQHYLYEATVCAGLPVINTLQDIVKSGDEVTKIEGIVSGTLSYIFNEMAKGRTFSDIVIEAKQRGFTEPDPREDLSGLDFARKIVCLARELGYDICLENINVYNLVPEELKNCSVEEFLEKLPEHDKKMAAFVTEANAKKEKLCYVGIIDHAGHVSVALNSFAESHPFSRMQGSDNMIIFHTKRYCERPLVIQGPGAGAEVTAAGIFADLLRLVSFLS